jgi:protein O-mannosyl-transferase
VLAYAPEVTVDREARRRLVPPLALAALTAIVYINAAPPVLIFDDALVISDNPVLRGPRAIPRLFRLHARAGSPDSSRLYRPLAMATLALDHSLYRGSPRGYHVTSVALQVGVTLVLFAFLGMVGIPRGAAFVAALVFGVHPIHTEAVDFAFNRSEILAALFVLAALWWLFRELDRRPWAAWAGLVAAYFLGLCSRESAVMLPALAVLLVLVLRPAPFRAQLRRLWPVVALLLPLAAYLALRQAALGEPGGGVVRSLTEDLGERAALNARLPLVAATMRDYLRMLFWPWPLRVSYVDYELSRPWLALALHVALLGGAAALWRRVPALLAGLGFFYLALLPSTKLFSDPAVIAERFVYLPSAGAALALAFGLAALGRRHGARALVLCGVALCAALAPLTLLRNLDFHSARALWEAEVRASDHNWQALQNLGFAYVAEGRAAEALALADRGLRFAPSEYGLHTVRGVALAKLGRTAEAEPSLVAAVRLSRERSRELANLARLYAELGRTRDAEAAYRGAMATAERPALRHLFEGELLRHCRGDERAARAAFAAALALEPGLQAARAQLDGSGPTIPP